MDWFICKAASTELQEAPSHEKIAFRHAFLSSLQDKTAFVITSRFETALKEAHAALFPLSQTDPHGPAQYSDPPSTSGYLFDTQPTPSPPRAHPESTTHSHPLAPRDPSSLPSTLLSQTTAAQLPRRSPRHSLSAVLIDVENGGHSNNSLFTPFSSLFPTTSLSPTSLPRARSTPASARQSHSDPHPPALLGVGALFRVHLPPTGRRGLGR